MWLGYCITSVHCICRRRFNCVNASECGNISTWIIAIRGISYIPNEETSSAFSTISIMYLTIRNRLITYSLIRLDAKYKLISLLLFFSNEISILLSYVLSNCCIVNHYFKHYCLYGFTQFLHVVSLNCI
jgi:hypothetical protein